MQAYGLPSGATTAKPWSPRRPPSPEAEAGIPGRLLQIGRKGQTLLLAAQLWGMSGATTEDQFLWAQRKSHFLGCGLESQSASQGPAAKLKKAQPHLVSFGRPDPFFSPGPP